MEQQRPYENANGNRETKEESSIATKSNRYAGGRQFRFIYDVDLPFTQKYLLHAIASYLPVDMEQPFAEKAAWPSYEGLVELTGMSEACVKKTMRMLTKAGFVQKESQYSPNGKQEPNLYRIEPTLPAFYEYCDLLKRSKRAPLRELSSIDERFQAISREIWLDLRLDERDLNALIKEKPGLYEKRVKSWIASERRRGVDWCQVSGSDASDTGANPEEAVSSMNSEGVPQNPLRGVPQNPLRGVPQNPLRGVPQNPLRGVPQITKETSNEVTDYEPASDWSGWRYAQRAAFHEGQ